MNSGQKLGVAGIFVILICLVSTASATLELLPESSYHQGKAYSKGTRVDFAVYDTQTYPDEFVGIGGYSVPGDNPGRFIYAYQIFTSSFNTVMPVWNFHLIGIGDDAIESVDVLGTVDDDSDGVDATDMYFNETKTTGVWEFDQGTLIAGEHSVFLVISSDHNYGKGRVEVNAGIDDEVPIPAPEPATLVMLALGGTLFFVKKGK